MMEKDVLTMRICKDIIGSNWFLRIGAVRAVACSAQADGTEPVPRARRQPRPKYMAPFYLTGGYKSE